MHRGLVGVACVVAVAAIVVPSAAAQTKEGDEVTQLLNDFLVPFSNQDVPKFIEYFADDATVFFPSARFSAVRVEGRAAIARTFEQVFQSSATPTAARPMIRPQDVKVQRFGDTAIVTFHLGSNESRSRRTFVLRRIDSQWKIVHLHASQIS
jgi:ketosteroid isomerase-like protein